MEKCVNNILEVCEKWSYGGHLLENGIEVGAGLGHRR